MLDSAYLGAAPSLEPWLLPEREFGADRDYWLEKLDDLRESSCAGLPLDFARSTSRAVRWEQCRCGLDAETSAALERLAGGERVRAFCVLLSALKACLYRYTGREDLAILTTTPHAPDGAFADPLRLARLNHLLLLRNRIEPSLSWAAWLERVRLTLAQAYLHRRFPAHRLLLRSEPVDASPRSLRASIAVLFEGITDRGLLTGQDLDVVVEFALVNDGFSFDFEYRAELFQLDTIRRFGEHMRGALERILREPRAPLAALTFASDGAASCPRELRSVRLNLREPLLHRLVWAQACAAPDRIAVACGDDVLTYRELTLRSDRLAWRLRELGAQPGAHLGVLFEPGLEAIIAIIAIMKAGATYVPFDPSHPPARLASNIADAKLRALLTSSKHAARAPEGVETLTIEALLLESQNAPGRPSELATPAGLAYVIFTSGSTGRQKGVAIAHASLANYVCWARQSYAGSEGECSFALCSSLAFDLAITAVFVPLVSGGKVVVAREADSQSWEAAALGGEIGALKLTPSHLAQARSGKWLAAGVSTLVVGGEALTARHIGAVEAGLARGALVMNEYGPTEATVGCAVHRVGLSDLERATMPIGRPFAGAGALVLSPMGTPCDVLELGELYVSGPGLAHGYLGLPDLTAEKFVPHPFAEGTRVYRTGDLTRVRADGSLTFHGRADDQIKLQGHRLELGEVQAMLNRHPEVQDSVARLLETPSGDPVLVAYYAARRPIEPTALRAFLVRELLAATVPQLFCHVSRFPLTLNGKVDLEALPTLEEVQSRTPRGARPLVGETECTVARIWASSLGVTVLYGDSNFFELGGHSLLASQVAYRVDEAFGVRVPMRALFETPELAAFAQRIDELRGADNAWAAALAEVEALTDEDVRRLSADGT